MSNPTPNMLDFDFTASMTDAAKAERLRDASAELGRRRRQALTLYEPLPLQDAFHQSLASERILRGGNRSGKSLTCFAETARAALGLDPYGKYPVDRPLLIWVVCFEEGQIGRTAYRLLFKPGAFKIIRDPVTHRWRAWRPWDAWDKLHEQKCKPAPPLIPARYAPFDNFSWKDKGRRIFNVCRLQLPEGHPMQGTEIHAFPSGGEPPMGDPVDVIHIDEDLKYPRHLGEFEARLSDTKGRLHWSVWPWGSNYALRNLAKRAELDRGMAEPDVAEWVITFSGNPFIDADQKRKRLKGWSAEERRSRDEGQFPEHSGKVYPTFHIDVHGLPDDQGNTRLNRALRKKQVPSNWTRYMVVDPGRTVGAVLFAAVPPPDAYGEVCVYYDELYIKNCDAVKFSQAVRSRLDGHSFRAFIIDDHGSRQHEMGSGLTVRQQYTQELQRLEIRSETTGHGFLPGSDDVSGRIMEVQRWLRPREDAPPRFRLLREMLPNMVEEFDRYQKRVGRDEITDKPIAEHNHLMNCLEYLAAYNPQYHPPKSPHRATSPGYRMWEEWKEHERRRSGVGDGLHLGPGSGRYNQPSPSLVY